MIIVSDLKYSYPRSGAPTLKGLEFEISQGEIFGFLGPSGAGKSTCQKILYKILSDFEGEIMIGGRALQHWGPDYFSMIGVGFELPNHYGKLSAKENLAFFSSFYKKKNLSSIPELLSMVGLEPDIDKPVDSFSKGMKMRLNFVRAIMHNPDVLFFDEPTAGLDPTNARLIMDHILHLKSQGKTIFITTHNMNTADELCDRVAFLVAGEINVTGIPSALKLKYGKNVVRVELKNGKTAEFLLEMLGSNPGFLKFIKDQEILRIHTQEATLEKVFIEVTGKSLNA